MPDCIFCKIVSGEIPTEQKVYQDNKVIAFLDIHPARKGHTLVIPREHHVNIYEIPDDALCDMMRAVKLLSVAVKKALGAQGIRVAMNNDSAAGQIIFHAHVHIVPEDGRDGPRQAYAEGEMAAYAEKIRAALH